MTAEWGDIGWYYFAGLLALHEHFLNPKENPVPRFSLSTSRIRYISRRHGHRWIKHLRFWEKPTGPQTLTESDILRRNRCDRRGINSLVTAYLSLF
jgi:hypothetical protein